MADGLRGSDKHPVGVSEIENEGNGEENLVYFSLSFTSNPSANSCDSAFEMHSESDNFPPCAYHHDPNAITSLLLADP